jgi:predicted acetyltransferase
VAAGRSRVLASVGWPSATVGPGEAVTVSAELTVEPLAEGDELAFARAVSRHFYEDEADDELQRWLPVVRDRAGYRAWVARAGTAIVANYGIHTMDVSVPGGEVVPCAGVTAVGVAQTHRRRGLLRRMMEAGLDDAVERGEPVALLYASESPIYGRFGFGVTAPSVVHRIVRPVAFHAPVDPGLVEPATPEQAMAQWPAVYDAFRRQRPGAVSRSEHRWRLGLVEDPPSWRDGASARRLVHVPGRGFARYRVKDSFEDQLPDGEVQLGELVALDDEAEAALWQHVCELDLTARITAWWRPPDDALHELLVDRLRARTGFGPPLYARLLDVPAAFEARTYAGSDRLVLEVHDGFRDATGTYELDVDGDAGAQVRRVDAEPDLRLPVDALASVWLGGVRATQLRAGRRLVELTAGASDRLDRLTWVPRAPWNTLEF